MQVWEKELMPYIEDIWARREAGDLPEEFDQAYTDGFHNTERFLKSQDLSNFGDVKAARMWANQWKPRYDKLIVRLNKYNESVEQGVAEAQTDYQKRRQRERDVDAGKPVSRQPKNPQTDYARKRAKEKRDLEQFGEDEVDDFVKAGGKITYGKPQKGPRRPGLSLASRHIGGGGDRMKPSRTGRAGAAIGGKPVGIKEESSTSSEAVERAVLNRIMVAHTDLLMQFGPDKVMQAAEEVAYNVGDVDEIGTSDVSAYVNQVKQILGVEA